MCSPSAARTLILITRAPRLCHREWYEIYPTHVGRIILHPAGLVNNNSLFFMNLAAMLQQQGMIEDGDNQ
jgi:hypothetical protein